MNNYTRFTIILLFFLCRAFAQNSPIDDVITTPTKEIYDLLQDDKGFIWIADELGIRRYDGAAFSNYSHPLQSSLSMTDLAEDQQGRIWCHNFSGQVFYVEHDQMHLLEAYRYEAEKIFPRMAMCGNELLITSYRGLFVCNTQTLQCKYIDVAQTGVSSICIVKDEAVLYGNGSWYLYRKDRGLTTLEVNKSIFAGYDLTNFMLQPASNNDTIYAVCNPSMLLFTFTFSGDQLKLNAINKYSSYINAVTVKKGEVWVHTKKESKSLTSGETINGYNLSCITKDAEGNTWYSSLDNGLMVSYAHEPWSVVKDVSLKAGDFIRCIKYNNRYLVAGSQQGMLLVKDSTFKTIQHYTLPAGAGSVEKIGLLQKDNFLIATSLGLYLLQPATGKLQLLNHNIVAKDIAFNRNKLYIATSKGLLQAEVDTSEDVFLSVSYTPMFSRRERCRAVCYDDVTGTLWVSYGDGLYQWHGKDLMPVLYDGKPVHTSSLESNNGKVYAGTFSGNLIVIQQGRLKKYTFKKNNFNNAVLRMVLLQNNLWILNAFGVNIFNIDNERFIYNQGMPYLNGSDVWDAEAIGQSIYIATNANLYKVPVNKAKFISVPSLYTRYFIVNSKDTVFSNTATLNHTKNNLSFYIATPWYNKNSIVTIRYQLQANDKSNNDNTQWYLLENNSRVIQLSALAPGDYNLKIQAGINGNFEPASTPVVYHVVITKPWYNRWWFYLLMAVLLAGILFGIYRYRINQLLKMERLRREISSNLHDDVGSTVSSINIYSQLLKNGQRFPDYIDMIQENTVQVMNSLDELVWNINPKYDLLEQLINKMRAFAVPLLSDNNIVCQFNIDVENGNKILLPDVRTDFYLIFKEAINNIVKHAQCSQCDISILQTGKLLKLSIKDNGKGFDVNTAALYRNGISSMQNRAKKLKGNLSIISTPGAGTQLTLACSVGSA